MESDFEGLGDRKRISYFAVVIWILFTIFAVTRCNAQIQSNDTTTSTGSQTSKLEAARDDETKPRLRIISSPNGIKKGGIVYRTGQSNGLEYELKLDVYVPNGKGPYPTVVCVHGGAWWAGAKWHMVRHAWKFLDAGYTVVAINYRHAPQFKHPAQIEDVAAAVRWMRVHADEYKIDSDRIVGFGYSAGAHLISLLATNDEYDAVGSEQKAKTSTRLSAVVAGGAPCEFSWISENSNALNYWMGTRRGLAPLHWKSATPIEFVSKDDPPFLFFHAEKDGLVPPDSSKKMHERLKQAGVESTRLTYSSYGHVTMFSNLETVDHAIKFYNRILNHRRPRHFK